MTRTIDLEGDVAEILLSEAEIQERVAELGERISDDYAGQELTLVSVLKGSLPFMADLMRAITVPVRIDLMEVSSYGGTSTESSGLVRILKDLSASIEGRDVLIVEDIIDTGLTLHYLLRYLRGKNPRSLPICTLLDKPARRLVEIQVDYVGLPITERFVTGSAPGSRALHRDLRVVAGWRGGFQAAFLARLGNDFDKGSLQVDLSYPLQRLAIRDLGMYLHGQFFTGYGESLLEYDESTTSFRLGLSLVR